MQLKITKHHRKDGSVRHQVSYVEAYRPGKGMSPKQRTVKNWGYLEDQEDPEAFLAERKAEIEELRKRAEKVVLEMDTSKLLQGKDNWDLCYGPYLLRKYYDLLELPLFFEENRDSKAKYDLNEIFRYLVTMRCMYPDSKRSSYAKRDHIYGETGEFELEDIYRSLDELSELRYKLQKHLNRVLAKYLRQDTDHLYMDTTNFYTERDYAIEDTLPQKGVSKEHRVDPIIQMGLFMDSKGLPVMSDAFPGNTSDCVILQPMMEKMREDGLLKGKTIVVADKGINTDKNINYLCNHGDGYLFSQTLRGTKGKRYEKDLFDEGGYHWNKEHTYKWKLLEEEVSGKDGDGKKITRKQKVLLYWDKGDAERTRLKREGKLKKAEKSLKNGAYALSHGSERYITETLVDETSGEVLDPVKVLSVDKEKAAEEAKYDGYFALVCSELDYSEKQMRQFYHELWKIEESFRVEKTDLDTRPIYVRLDERIRAHLLICHVALLIMRLIQHSMGGKPISVERIARVFRNCVLDIPQNGILHLHAVTERKQFKSYLDEKGRVAYTMTETGKDEVAGDFIRVSKALGIDLKYAYMRQEEFNTLIRKGVIPLQN